MDRYKELKDIYRNDANLKEKSFDTIELANANAKQLIMSKYDEYYYFFRKEYLGMIILIIQKK